MPLTPRGALAVVTSITIRRAITCSCPLMVGCLIGSRKQISAADLYDPDGVVRAFDDALTPEHVRLLVNDSARRLPPIAHVHRLASHVALIEFGAARPEARPERAGAAAEDGGADGPYPLAWFSFAPLGSASLAYSTERGELKCTLRAPRAMRSVVLMLISAEDRMFFMHDEHADPNIDLEFCGLSGHVLPDEAT